MKIKSYAIVLGGGGANGSYQIGVWKALKKLHIKLEAVIGNSVGSLNGAMIIMGNLNLAVKLWQTITLDKIVKINSEKLNKLSPESILKIIKVMIKNGGLDTEPLRNLFDLYIDEKKIRKSKIDFGIMTYSLDKLKPIQLFIDEIEEGLLKDYLLASASIPILFKPKIIGGKTLIDGGVYDNIPYSLAKDRGYKNIIVVDISGLGLNRKPDIEGTNTIYIKNSLPLADTIIDFDPNKAANFIQLGYLDTLKTFNKLSGVKYFIKNNKRIIKKIEKILLSNDIDKELPLLISYKNKDHKTNKIKEYLPSPFNKNKNLILSLLECAALSLNIERNKLYNLRDFINTIWWKYQEIENKISEIKNFDKAFELFSKKIFSITSLNDVIKLFTKSSLEYEKGLELFIKDEELLNKVIQKIFPHLIGAKIAFILLKKYFKK